MTERHQHDSLPLPGLDGSNPLAFLAALGTLRTVTAAWPQREVKMAWAQARGRWQPSLTVASDATNALDPGNVLDALDAQLGQGDEIPALAMADDLTISHDQFREAAEHARQHAHDTCDRRWCDFLVAFGSEAHRDAGSKDPIIEDTAFRTMSGAGHQHFLKFMRHLIEQTTRQHLHKALFESWRYDDPVASMTLRWDPVDDDPYALRWRNPSGDPARNQGGSMWGAYRLAIEGLPLLPTMPTARRVETTGFAGRGSRDTYWTWPIWTVPVALETCQSILSSRLVQTAAMSGPEAAHQHDGWVELAAVGVAALFRSQRITVGKYRCFTPARAV